MTLGERERFVCLQMRGSRIPPRFNASFQYRGRGGQSAFSTDIASGAKSCVYPPKFRHWGHAYTNDGFDTVVLIRNNSHAPQSTKDARGLLTLYSADDQAEVPVEVAAESALTFKVSGSIRTPQAAGGPRFVSWMLEMDVPTCETFWVAHRAADGAVFGEHGF
jgi:hypothetical protein